MTILLVVVALAVPCTDDEALRPGAISREYTAIANDLRQSQQRHGRDRKSSDALLAAAKIQFRSLVQRADLFDEETLLAADYVALCACAEHLDDREKALVYAVKAVRVAKDVQPCANLVRLLCSLGKLSDAEVVIRQATQRHADDEWLYLLHNIMALQYRKDHLSDDAYRHMEATCSLLIRVLRRDPFYAAHLARCLEILAELAGENGEGTFPAALEKWSTQISERLSREHGQRTLLQDGRLAAADLSSVRLDTEALIALHSHSPDDDGESALLAWSDVLMACKNNAETRPIWLKEVDAFAIDCARSVGPTWDGGHLKDRLRELGREIGDADGADDGRRVRRNLSAAIAVLDQHRRLQALVGTRLTANKPFSGLDSGGAQYSIVHVTSALSPAFRDGLQSFVLKYRHHLRNNEIEAAFCIIGPTSHSLGSATHKQESKDQSSKAEPNVVAQIRSALKTSRDLQRIEIADANAIGVRMFPVNILLDPSGKVVAALTGPASVSRLLRHPRASSTNPSVAH